MAYFKIQRLTSKDCEEDWNKMLCIGNGKFFEIDPNTDIATANRFASDWVHWWSDGCCWCALKPQSFCSGEPVSH